MTDKSFKLIRGEFKKPKEKLEPVMSIVHSLEEILDLAKKGQVRAVAFVMKRVWDGGAGIGVYFDEGGSGEWLELLGGISHLHNELEREIAEAYRTENDPC